MESDKMQIIWTIMMIAAIIGMAKRQPIWKQTTFTEGADKGAVDWLKNGTEINPSEIEIASAKDMQAYGYDMPDFVMEKPKAMVVILRDRNDPQRRPLLIHQGTAYRSIMRWLSDVKGNVAFEANVDSMTTDENWHLKFSRGKAKFSPYVTDFVLIVD